MFCSVTHYFTQQAVSSETSCGQSSSKSGQESATTEQQRDHPGQGICTSQCHVPYNMSWGLFTPSLGWQVCIPIGCVPPVCWPYPIVSLPGRGVCLTWRGSALPGGWGSAWRGVGVCMQGSGSAWRGFPIGGLHGREVFRPMASPRRQTPSPYEQANTC